MLRYGQIWEANKKYRRIDPQNYKLNRIKGTTIA